MFRFLSFPTPRRVDPFNSLPHLPRPPPRRSVCAVLRAVLYGDQRRPSAADGDFATIERDVQGNEVMVATMGLASHPTVTTRALL